MDPTRVDALARMLSVANTRRRALGLFLGAGFAGFGSESSGKKGKKRKPKKDNARAQRRDKGNDRKGKERRAQAPRVEATRCCNTGNCSPGKGKNLAKCCYQGQDLTGKNFSGPIWARPTSPAPR